MFWVYAALMHLLLLLLLPLWVLHPKLRGGFRQRLGLHPAGWPGAGERPVVWFHGASAGDVLAQKSVIAELKAAHPELFVLQSCVTNSGYEIARRGIAGVDAAMYAPLDLPWTVARVMRAVRPRVLVLEYTELWPALIRGAKKAGAAVVLGNGRIHPRRVWRYRLLYRLIGNPLRWLDRLCMREPEEAQRVLALGADPARVVVTGNTKYDAFGPEDGQQCGDDSGALRAELGWPEAAPVLVCGSTHAGEEGPLLDVYAALREGLPDLRLLIAPRYPERSRDVLHLCRKRNLAATPRSRCPAATPVIVLDTVGELRALYRIASAVVVGGSFVRRGGQNLLEPAACRKPVLFGPDVENFADAARRLVGRGGILVADFARLRSVLAALLAQPAELERLGELAFEAVAGVKGASRREAEAIGEELRRVGAA
jgi:3-deoxy-D-manno-octulosonic-acid transferase